MNKSTLIILLIIGAFMADITAKKSSVKKVHHSQSAHKHHLSEKLHKSAHQSNKVFSKLKKAQKTLSTHLPQTHNLRFIQNETDLAKVQANIVFKQNPKGVDKYEKIIEEDVYLLNTKTTVIDLNQVDEFKKEHLRLNRHALYYVDAEKSYRGIEASIQLQDLVSSGDKIEQGGCCSSISSLNKKKIMIDGTLSGKSYNCFTITSPTANWQICFDEFQKASSFKKELIKNIISQELEKIGKFNFNFITGEQPAPQKYTWLNQQLWGGSCQKGKNQSPSKIYNSKALEQVNFRMQFHFAQNVKAIASFDGMQQNIIGNFGSFVFQRDQYLRTFQIEKLQFKFPAEHIVNDQRFEGELLVFGKKVGSDQTGILSFMLQVSKDASKNQFVESIQPELWKIAPGSTDINLQNPSITLNNIVNEGIIENFRKSFFYYQGSYSDPPCEEGVFRFVMITPILLTQVQLDTLKAHSYQTLIETNGNARDAIDFNPQRILYLHIDKSKGCETKPEQQKKKKKEDQCDDAKPDGKFIKATTSVSTYSVTDQKTLPSGDFGGGLKIEYVQESEVPTDILDQLQDEAKIIEQKNCHKRMKKALDDKYIDEIVKNKQKK